MTGPFPEDEIQRRIRGAVIRAVLITSVACGTVVAVLISSGYLTTRRTIGGPETRPPARPQAAPQAPPATASFDTIENPNSMGLVASSAPPGLPTSVAEVLPSPQQGRTVIAVQPYVGWSIGPVDGRLLVQVRELKDPRDPVGGVVLAAGSVERFDLPRGDYVRVDLDHPVVLVPGRYYSYRFSVADRNVQVGIGLVDVGDPTPEGRLWIFGRPEGANGGILSERPEWLLRDVGDIVFRLIFE